MKYIRLTKDRQLIITINDPIYRGETLNQKIAFLLPPQLDEIDITSSTVELFYACPNSAVKRATLKLLDEVHADYLQFAILTPMEMTKEPGPVFAWLKIQSNDGSAIAKSGKCILHVITDSVVDNDDDEAEVIDDNGAVLYSKPQALVEAEQQQALENIGLDEEAVQRALDAAGMIVEDQG